MSIYTSIKSLLGTRDFLKLKQAKTLDMTSLRALLAYNMREKRRILNISQAQLAEKVATSAHYISQIEQKNKFPSPEMLERIANALEIDSPQLFSMDSFADEAIKRFQEGVMTDLGNAVTLAVGSRLSELKKMG
jgi:transcriptional regulator with XRE-family HTH domain